MRKIASNMAVQPTGEILRNPIIIIDDDGFVSSFETGRTGIREEANLEYYSGLLLPDLFFPLSKLTGEGEMQLKNNPGNIESLWYSKGVACIVYTEKELFESLKYFSLIETNYISDIESKNVKGFTELSINDPVQFNPIVQLYRLQVDLQCDISYCIKKIYKLYSNLLNTICTNSMSIGQKAGLNLVSGIDFEKKHFTENSHIRRLV